MNQLLLTFNSMELHAKQDRAVGKYLKAHGEIDKDWAYQVGLPECGRIKNLAQRVRNLRLEGWNIKTEDRNGRCYYVLV